MTDVAESESNSAGGARPQTILQGFADGSVTEPLSGHEIDGLTPEAVFAPDTIEALCAALATCNGERLSVSPVGGLTRTRIGKIPARYDVAISTSRLRSPISHNQADLTATVEAGITVSSLQESLAEHGQFVAIDPPLPDQATVGGTLAIGNSGPLRWQGWGLRDIVIGMKVASPNGDLTKSGGQVVKNVSGYDMSRLHIGGLGTLGIVAEVSFKLTPLPAGQATILASFRRPGDAFEAGMSVFHGRSSPLAMTLLSPVAAQRLNLIRKGSHHLAVRLHGRPRTLERMIDEATAACGRHDTLELDRLDGAEHERIWRAVADFGWDESTRPAASVRISLPPAIAGEVLASLESAAAARGLMPALVTHVPSGTVLVHLYCPGESINLGALAQVIADARKLTRQRRGSAVLEQAPVKAKQSIDVWDGGGEAMAIMRRLKDLYDPNCTLNPGRYVGGI